MSDEAPRPDETDAVDVDVDEGEESAGSPVEGEGVIVAPTPPQGQD